ncbi:hypothetical protein F4083_07635 [Candidatus Poribacteria bacterium]|nr:hypothetical protein [Candidatus Poribacteria bacterium]
MGKKSINSMFRWRSSRVYAGNINSTFNHDGATKHVILRNKVLGLDLVLSCCSTFSHDCATKHVIPRDKVICLELGLINGGQRSPMKDECYPKKHNQG